MLDSAEGSKREGGGDSLSLLQGLFKVSGDGLEESEGSGDECEFAL